MKDKLYQYFEGRVVRKDLTSHVRGSAVVPTFVLEYLLGQNCAIDDEEIIQMGIEKVKEIISRNYVHPNEAELVKSKIREDGQYKVIDKISVHLNDKKNVYEAAFAHLNLRNVQVADRFVQEHQKLLSGGGVWCIIKMGYSHASDTENRWIIEDLKPIQVAYVDLEEYIANRQHFTTDEWMDVLMHTIGLDPAFFNRRDKFIQLSRLIPHVESNFNFIELGPKGTGKSHVFSELSPHGVLISGGDVTQATMFVNNNGNRLGLVNYWDVVAMDEFEQEQGGKRTDPALVKTLQNYMANRSFNRGKETYHATASLAFVGNTKKSVPYMLRSSHLFESIPAEYLKGAFLDRMHLYIPGWEVKILKESVFSSGYGFIVDFLAEVLRELRKIDFSGMIEDKTELSPTFSKRDKEAIRKTFSGMVKLLYPDKRMTEAEFYEVLDFAVEGRRRVKEEIFKIDETFLNSPVEFMYTVRNSGREVEVDTLEKLNYASSVAQDEDGLLEGGTAPAARAGEPEGAGAQGAATAGSVGEGVPAGQSGGAAAGTGSSPEGSGVPGGGTGTGLPAAKPKSVSIRDNQTGITYRKLFGPYLKEASKVEIIDPYIRLPHQMRNFMEFCVMFGDLKGEGEEASVHLITWNEADFIERSEESFKEMRDALEEIGIRLTWEFRQFHDRVIMTDNGWKINLGRGLDIFMPRENRYDIGSLKQEKRQCKATEITFFPNG